MTKVRELKQWLMQCPDEAEVMVVTPASPHYALVTFVQDGQHVVILRGANQDNG